MKFKVFLFGMIAAALMMSCNNETVYGPDAKNPVIGESTSATINLNFKNAKTYAGEEESPATGYEIAVRDAAVYIYKWDGANMEPEAMAYVANANMPIGGATVSGNRAVTLMVKNGEKKIFVALNIGNTTTPLLDNNGGVFTFIARPDTGIAYTSTTFSALNNILYSTAASITTTDPSIATPGFNGNGNGLIQTLAAGSIVSSNGVLYSTSTPGTAGDGAFCLMTNWDGPVDKADGTAGTYIYTSDCKFFLLPNISAADSKTGPDNNFEIGVQRAYAKISLRITADGAGVNTGAGYVGPYTSSESDGSQGQFTPWKNTAATPQNIWALGGINKRTYPFQLFAGTQSAVASPNYALATGDVIDTTNPANSDAWYDSYDNTRVFGSSAKVYGLPANTVTNVRDNVRTAGNSLALSPADGTISTMLFAMCTENGTEFPQLHDRSTFAIVGGVYAPKNVLTGIQNPAVTTNPAEKGWNGAAPVVNASSTGYDVNTYYALNYSAVGMDTLYYLVSEKVFIHGRDNLIKYYAWELKKDKDEADPVTNLSTDVADAINTANANGSLLGYYQGNCFYRVWIKDPTAAATSSLQDEVLVRRNHIYDVNINKIKGPGIADPNSIIVPGVEVPELDTFVTVEIKILDWHVVRQEQDVSYQ